ncbi:L-type lectin-domain containing receptor kinase IX.1-like protein [Drosera capensis]
MLNTFTFTFVLVFSILIPQTKSVTFNFTSFLPDDPNLILEGDTTVESGLLQLTTNQRTFGRAHYAHPVPLWGPDTSNLTDFTTAFSFTITPIMATYCATCDDGLAFFIKPTDAPIPVDSTAGCLGLVSQEHYNDTTKNQLLAVEFDTFMDAWDPSSYHLGIDVNSIVSVDYQDLLRNNYNPVNGELFITYSSTTKTLDVFLSYTGSEATRNVSLSYQIDLTTILPETVNVGLSAGTHWCPELHQVHSWNFSSTLQRIEISAPSPAPEPPINYVPTHKMPKLIIAMIVGVATATVVGAIAYYWFIHWRKRSATNYSDSDTDEDYGTGTGPKKFLYEELKHATNNFAEERKLGEGGFGSVYRGLLQNPNTEIAVKRVSKGSKQGKKEFASEVKIISRLRHRHLVQLLGWCKQRRDLLLVYEYLANGSIDTHLFGTEAPLAWPVRHKITLGLASGLLYLQEEGEQCVIHRDIKSSNIMLDSNFIPKLGDFGLARLMDHEVDSRTTVIAGTRGYLAPECAMTGKASKESDIYSFGVVLLEIATGKKALSINKENMVVTLVQWVWNLYGRGLLSKAIDPALDDQYDEDELERVIMVGLWCCHPDQILRPTIRQCLSILNLESPLPKLPLKLPSFVYSAPPMNMSMITFESSSSKTKTTTTSFSGDYILPSTSSSFCSNTSSSTNPKLPLLR